MSHNLQLRSRITVSLHFGISPAHWILLLLLGYSLVYSAPDGSVWGWSVAAVLIQLVQFEIITGQSNFTGQVNGPCSVNFASSAMILLVVQIGNPGYVVETFHVYLPLVALFIFEGALTTTSTNGSTNHPKTNNSEVWTSKRIVNGTEWPTEFAFSMGFLTVIWTMSGHDASFHLAEECSNANIANPRSILMEILCLRVLGPKAGLAMFSLDIFSHLFLGQKVAIYHLETWNLSPLTCIARNVTSACLQTRRSQCLSLGGICHPGPKMNVKNTIQAEACRGRDERVQPVQKKNGKKLIGRDVD
ncbi:unnamed protein product [Diplocarpon coronariae]